MSTITTEVTVHKDRIYRLKRMRIAVNQKPDERPPQMVSFWYSEHRSPDGDRHEGCVQWVHKFGPFYKVYATCENSMGNVYGYADPDVVDPDSAYAPHILAKESPKIIAKNLLTDPHWVYHLVRTIFFGVGGFIVGRYLLN